MSDFGFDIRPDMAGLGGMVAAIPPDVMAQQQQPQAPVPVVQAPVPAAGLDGVVPYAQGPQTALGIPLWTMGDPQRAAAGVRTMQQIRQGYRTEQQQDANFQQQQEQRQSENAARSATLQNAGIPGYGSAQILTDAEVQNRLELAARQGQPWALQALRGLPGGGPRADAITDEHMSQFAQQLPVYRTAMTRLSGAQSEQDYQNALRMFNRDTGLDGTSILGRTWQEFRSRQPGLESYLNGRQQQLQTWQEQRRQQSQFAPISNSDERAAANAALLGPTNAPLPGQPMYNRNTGEYGLRLPTNGVLATDAQRRELQQEANRAGEHSLRARSAITHLQSLMRDADADPDLWQGPQMRGAVAEVLGVINTGGRPALAIIRMNDEGENWVTQARNFASRQLNNEPIAPEIRERIRNFINATDRAYQQIGADAVSHVTREAGALNLPVSRVLPRELATLPGVADHYREGQREYGEWVNANTRHGWVIARASGSPDEALRPTPAPTATGVPTPRAAAAGAAPTATPTGPLPVPVWEREGRNPTQQEMDDYARQNGTTVGTGPVPGMPSPPSQPPAAPGAPGAPSPSQPPAAPAGGPAPSAIPPPGPAAAPAAYRPQSWPATRPGRNTPAGQLEAIQARVGYAEELGASGGRESTAVPGGILPAVRPPAPAAATPQQIAAAAPTQPGSPPPDVTQAALTPDAQLATVNGSAGYSRADALARISHAESRGRNIPNAGGGAAFGLYQFMPNTYAPLARSLGLQPNIRQASPEDQHRVAALYAQRIENSLQRGGVPVTPTTLYMGWGLGERGAVLAWNMAQQNPNATGADLARAIWPSSTRTQASAIRQNPGFFPQGGRAPIAQTIAYFAQHMGGSATPVNASPPTFDASAAPVLARPAGGVVQSVPAPQPIAAVPAAAPAAAGAPLAAAPAVPAAAVAAPPAAAVPPIGGAGGGGGPIPGVGSPAPPAPPPAAGPVGGVAPQTPQVVVGPSGNPDPLAAYDQRDQARLAAYDASRRTSTPGPPPADAAAMLDQLQRQRGMTPDPHLAGAATAPRRALTQPGIAALQAFGAQAGGDYAQAAVQWLQSSDPNLSYWDVVRAVRAQREQGARDNPNAAMAGTVAGQAAGQTAAAIAGPAGAAGQALWQGGAGLLQEFLSRSPTSPEEAVRALLPAATSGATSALFGGLTARFTNAFGRAPTTAEQQQMRQAAEAYANDQTDVQARQTLQRFGLGEEDARRLITNERTGTPTERAAAQSGSINSAERQALQPADIQAAATALRDEANAGHASVRDTLQRGNAGAPVPGEAAPIARAALRGLQADIQRRGLDITTPEVRDLMRRAEQIANRGTGADAEAWWNLAQDASRLSVDHPAAGRIAEASRALLQDSVGTTLGTPAGRQLMADLRRSDALHSAWERQFTPGAEALNITRNPQASIGAAIEQLAKTGNPAQAVELVGEFRRLISQPTEQGRRFGELLRQNGVEPNSPQARQYWAQYGRSAFGGVVDPVAEQAMQAAVIDAAFTGAQTTSQMITRARSLTGNSPMAQAAREVLSPTQMARIEAIAAGRETARSVRTTAADALVQNGATALAGGALSEALIHHIMGGPAMIGAMLGAGGAPLLRRFIHSRASGTIDPTVTFEEFAQATIQHTLGRGGRAVTALGGTAGSVVGDAANMVDPLTAPPPRRRTGLEMPSPSAVGVR